MSFKTNAVIQNNYYGRWAWDGKNQTYVFEPLGKAINIDRITDNIETDDTQLTLSFDYIGETKRVTIDREELADNTLIKTLAAKGADVTKKHFDILVDTLRRQEEFLELNGQRTDKVYTHLGWFRLPTYNQDGTRAGSILCCRANHLIGGYPAKYIGPYAVAPTGSYDAWKDMVMNDVVGVPAMAFVLIASLSAVVNGLLSPATTGENPIIHLCCGSSGGKTTALFLATSAYGAPFDGERRCQSETGEFKVQRSLYSSWGSTENATITQCAGNKGAAIVLNELGKFKGRDMTRIVYDLSEGTDKARLNSNMEAYTSEGYSTTILSAGEISLLSRCTDKLEGLQNRVMEIDQPLTTDADHSRRIKETCRHHNGWAAPVLAEYIIQNGGLPMVLALYKDHRKNLSTRLPDTPAKERFIEKFAALFVTTAELASKALDIDFDIEGLIQFLVDHETIKGDERNTSKASYDTIIEACNVNKRCFFVKDEPNPMGKIHGRIIATSEVLDDGRVVVAEYLVRRSFVEQVLSEKGYPNIKTCAKEWRASGVLDAEDDSHPTRARKVEPAGKPERVFVFRVFGETVTPPVHKVKPASRLCLKRGTSPKAGSKIDQFLSDDEEDDTDD